MKNGLGQVNKGLKREKKRGKRGQKWVGDKLMGRKKEGNKKKKKLK